MVNILFLCNKKYFMHKMSRVRFHYIDAIALTPGNYVKYWGCGWDDYDETTSLNDNIQTLLTKIDVIICYKPLEHIGINKTSIPKIISYNEMEPYDRTLAEIKDSKIDVVVCHHLNEMHKYQILNSTINFVNIPHCSDMRFFKDYDLPKKYDIILIGRLSSNAYPLRTRMVDIVEQMASKYNVFIHTHPGYDIQNADNNYQTIEFAKLINQSRLAIFCSGKDRTRFSKYTEVAACCTGIVADIPDENQDEFRKFVIEISMDMKTNYIIDKITYYLNNTSRLNVLIQNGKTFANKYTTQYYAQRMMNVIHNLKPIQ